MNSRKTNEDECRAKRWLESQDHTDICRPCADPPDFVVEGCYAVEVRRLNWMTDRDGESKGIEDSEKPLERIVKKVLAHSCQPAEAFTVFVDCSYPFDRALPKTKVVESQVRDAVMTFHKNIQGDLSAGRSPTHSAIRLECGIELRFSPLRLGVPGGYELVDVDVATASRGWVVADATDNIARCIQKKTRKVAERDRVNDFRAWWLVLVDHIHAVPLREADLNKVRGALPPRDLWSRIIVVSPENPEWFFEL